MRERIEELMRLKGLNRQEFAEKIGVQRSNITHILEGRNRPSLDFIEKLANVYPALNLNWLVKGEGGMFKSVTQTSLFSDDRPPEITPHIQEEVDFPDETGDEYRDPLDNQDKDVLGERHISREPGNNDDNSGITYPKTIRKKEIEKIIIFYSDKTFDLYNPS